MRRMYSEQELTKIIKIVFEEELESGALDDLVSDAVDAYLVENPVDITALEGKDVSCKSVTTTNDISVGGALSTTGNVSIGGNLSVSGSINGESNPSVKPLYYHPIYLIDNTVGVLLSCVIINNSSTPFTWTSFKNMIETNHFKLCPINGVMIADNNTKFDICMLIYDSDSKYYGYGHKMDGTTANSLECTNVINSLFAEGHSAQFSDFVNKIN